MKLKKLEVVGFKSFAQKTEFEFGDGVTGIVGPNGCGKSNVLDSINWVLGTLSTKAVRGDAMLDVIFKGTQGLPPMAYAQVALTIDNSDHALPVPYEEVTVGRKIYRSGECDYFINKTLVRLKDIREMFFNTGLGGDNYSIIEQGKIDRMILTNPKQRRYIFDEVAGISKYKVKRREAKLKLEKVNHDLLRLEDLLKEVERELHSVRIQAGRARRYAELQTEFREKRVGMFLHDYKQILQDMSSIARELETLEARANEAAAKRDTAEQELQTRETKLREANESIQQVKLKMTELQGTLKNLQDTIARSERDEKEIRKQKLERASEHRTLTRKADALRPTTGKIRRQIEKLTKDSDRLHGMIDEIDQEMSGAREELQGIEQRIEAKQAEAKDLQTRDTEYKHERVEIQAQLKNIEGNLDKINRTLDKIEADAQETQMQREAAQANHSAASRTIQENLERKAELEKSKAHLEAELDASARELNKLKQDTGALEARHSTLKDLEGKLSGIEKGSKSLLDSKAAGIVGLVADHVDIDAEYVACMDAILRDLQGFVVAEDREAAMKGLDEVMRSRAGGVGIVAMDDGEDSRTLHPDMKTEGVLGRAGEFVRITNEGLSRTLARVFNRYIVVQDLATARRLVNEGTRDPIVTLDGLLFEDPRIEWLPSGGEKSVLSRRSELQQLQAEMDRCAQEIRVQENRRSELRRRHKDGQKELEAIRHAVYDRQLELATAQETIESLKERERVLQKEIETERAEHASITQEAGTLNEREGRLSGLLEELTTLKEQTEREATELSRIGGTYQAGVKKLQKKAEGLRVHAGKITLRREQLQEKSDRTFQEMKDLSARQVKLEEMIGDLDARARRARAEGGEAHGRIQRFEEDIERLRFEEKEARNGMSQLKADAKQAKEALDAIVEETESTVERARELQMKSQEQRIRMENLEARAREEIEMDLRERAAGYVEPGNVDWKASQAEVTRLKNRLSTFGNVNMLALEKLKELEERDTFCKDHRKDLQKSKGELEEFIDKVNTESHALFKKMIQEVRKHFNDIFRKVFGGGKADLQVENEANVDPLEQGVEVLCRLPKKEISKLSLMSGGERSLTAIALTLALFKTRPTAFCILDECDAALDESNVARYANLVKEFSKETQFIVITHNKRTMMVADKLYGITMQPAGVTRRVEVSFDRAQDMVEEKKES